MRSSRLWFILLVLLLIVPPLGAQDANDEQPLLDMLALVPDTSSARAGFISYIDYRAVEAARPGALQPASWAEWDAAHEAESSAFELWMAAFFGVSSGPSALAMTLTQAGSWPDVLGFDFFAVDRALEYSQPPRLVQVLQGDFDAEAIITAYEAQGFKAETSGDLVLLCGSVGCENGMDIDLENRDPANPFGGAFGRQEPLLIAPDHLVNSPDSEQIERHVALLKGEATSLADDPQFRAAAQVAAREGLLIQAQLVNAASLDAESSASESIPPYDLLLLADAATESEQIATVGLVYASADDAQAAAAALPGRIESYTSLVTRQALADVLAERGITYMVEVDEDAETGAAVALVVLRAPLAGADEVDGRLPPSSMIYRLFVQMLYQRDLGWIAP